MSIKDPTSPGREEGNSLKFLGTAGSRFVVARQLRSSGRIYLAAQGARVLIDPGPGSLVQCAASRPPIDPAALDAVILTHGHIDHSNDVNVVIDAMTAGGFDRRGTLFAPRDCLEGEGTVVFQYLRSFLVEIVTLEPGTDYRLGRLGFATSRRHIHGVDTFGFKFDVDGSRLSIVGDTKFYPGLADEFQGTDTLVLNVTRDTPFVDPGILHLTAVDARALIAAIKPRLTILTHFGRRMIMTGPETVARRLSEDLGRPVVAASDGWTVELGPEAANGY